MALASVITDSREPQWIRDLTFGGVPTTCTMLDAGDLLCATDTGDLIAIERKTAGDFLNTLRDERLFPQLTKLRQLTPWAYLLITGELRPGPNGTCWADGRQTQWNWWSVQGCLLSVQEIGVHVVQVGCDQEFEQSVIRLANRDRADMRIRPARDAAMVSDAEAILTAFPGIGRERVNELLRYSGSVAWAIQFLCDDTGFQDVMLKNIGEGVKRRIRRSLGLQDNELLAVVLKDTGNPVEIQEELIAK